MVTFYEIGADGKPTHPVLYLDTLKVSTIEQTAENSSARGGKANPELIVWDYNKSITVSLEDALFSAKSLAIMFGNGTAAPFTSDDTTDKNYIMKTETFVSSSLGTGSIPTEGTSAGGWNHQFVAPDGKLYTKLNPKFYTADGTEITDTNKATTWKGILFCSYDLTASGAIIDISASSFPGTYYITGDKPHNCLLAA